MPLKLVWFLLAQRNEGKEKKLFPAVFSAFPSHALVPSLKKKFNGQFLETEIGNHEQKTESGKR